MANRTLANKTRPTHSFGPITLTLPERPAGVWDGPNSPRTKAGSFSIVKQPKQNPIKTPNRPEIRHEQLPNIEDGVLYGIPLRYLTDYDHSEWDFTWDDSEGVWVRKGTKQLPHNPFAAEDNICSVAVREAWEVYNRHTERKSNKERALDYRPVGGNGKVSVRDIIDTQPNYELLRLPSGDSVRCLSALADPSGYSACVRSGISWAIRKLGMKPNNYQTAEFVVDAINTLTERYLTNTALWSASVRPLKWALCKQIRIARTNTARGNVPARVRQCLVDDRVPNSDLTLSAGVGKDVRALVASYRRAGDEQMANQIQNDARQYGRRLAQIKAAHRAATKRHDLILTNRTNTNNAPLRIDPKIWDTLTERERSICLVLVRHDATQTNLAEAFGVDQATISRTIVSIREKMTAFGLCSLPRG